MLILILCLFSFNCCAMENNIDELRNNIKLVDLTTDNTKAVLGKSYYDIKELVENNKTNLTKEQLSKLNEMLFSCVPFGD